MYRPRDFAEFRLEEVYRLVREYPLGVLVRQTSTGLDADHLPFFLEEGRGAYGYLLAHVARANPIWREVREGAEVMVVFRGPHGYISPNWYPSKQETHRHVPTWNYEVVHAHGHIHVREDEAFIRGVVARLTRSHESREPQPWKMRDAEAGYLAEQLSQIVGIEVEMTRLECKRKLSQNRDARDFDGVVQALEENERHDLASAMRQVKPSR